METETLATAQQIEAQELEESRKKELAELEEKIQKLPVAFKFKTWEGTRKAIWVLIVATVVLGVIVLAQ